MQDMGNLSKILKIWFSVANIGVVFSSLTLSAEEELTNHECFGDIYPKLLRAGYNRSLDCRELAPVIKKIGGIKINSQKYIFYNFIYRTIPVSGGVAHGGQKLLVFEGDNSLGVYDLEPPPLSGMKIHGNTIILLDVPRNLGNQIVFDNNGPPAKVFVNEEYINFYRFNAVRE